MDVIGYLADAEARNARRQEAGAIAAELLSLARHVDRPGAGSLIYETSSNRAKHLRMCAETLCRWIATDEESLLESAILNTAPELEDAITDYTSYARRYTSANEE